MPRFQLFPFRLPAAFEGASSPRLIDEDAPHRLGRRREEVPPPLEMLIADQFQIGLVNQRRGIERVAVSLVRQLCRRELTHLPVDKRHQFGRGDPVAALGRFQKLSE